MESLLIWDRRVVAKIKECVGEFIVACFFCSVEDGFSWAFVGAYEPNSDCVRMYLWEELAGLLSWWNFSWCIGGNFNVTRFPSERLRGTLSFLLWWSSQSLFFIRVLWISPW